MNLNRDNLSREMEHAAQAAEPKPAGGRTPFYWFIGLLVC